MENVRETTNERMNGEEKTEEERGREDGRGERRGGEKERERERCLSPERTARRMSRTRGYRGTEETGPRPNMIIELGERCERSTL